MSARKVKTAPPVRVPEANGMYVAKIKIGLKQGVSDPEGNNTLKALHLLGFQSIKDVHTERIVRIKLDASRKEDAKLEAERACRRLLTNPVIHDYQIEVEESK